MDEKIDVKINYLDKDISAAITGFINKSTSIWVVLLVSGLMFIIAMITGIINGFSRDTIVFILICLLLAYIFLYLYYIRPIRGYRSFYKTYSGAHFEFYESGFEVRREFSESKCEWRLIDKVFEIKEFFLLIDINKVLTIIPKRCFKSENDILNFRNLVGRVKKENFKRYS